MRIHLGQQGDYGRGVFLDLDVLIRTRMLLQASSGGGKSWTLRRILEQSHGHIQQIVLDPEGEFATLREKYDYVLVGKGGEVSAEPRHAPLLARRLMELGVSAIVDLFESNPSDRRRFVHGFLDALVDLPKNLWHPCLVVLDEAQDFAPEKGKGDEEALDAVIGLTGRGRKRGYCAVLATPRISKLSKDATASLRNRLMGLSVEDVDRKRSADEIGISDKKEILALRDLNPGDFFAIGPALRAGHPAVPVRERLQVHIGPVETSHPDIGRKAVPPPAPTERVKAILSKLADLPKEAEEEAQTVGALKAKVRELQQELRVRPVRTVDHFSMSRKVIKVPAISDKQIQSLFAANEKFRMAVVGIKEDVRAIMEGPLDRAVQRYLKSWGTMQTAIREVREGMGRTVTTAGSLASGSLAVMQRPLTIQRTHETTNTAAVRLNGDMKLGLAERKILSVLMQYPGGRTTKQLALLTGYALGGGAFRNPMSRLRTAGLIQGQGLVQITQAGQTALPAPDPLPDPGSPLLDYWMQRLGHAEREILRVLAEAYPKALPVEEIASRTQSSKGTPYEVGGGAFRAPMSRLRTLQVIDGRNEVRISPEIMGDETGGT